MFKYGKKHKNRKKIPQKGTYFGYILVIAMPFVLNRISGDYVIGGNGH